MNKIRAQKAVEMIAKVDELKESGLTIREFATRTGISKSTLEYWKQKQRDANKRAPRFIELVSGIASPEHSAGQPEERSTQGKAQIEFTFPNGMSIKIQM